MPIQITLNPQNLKEIRQRDHRLLSYNIEMTELTGGTFWAPYTDGQIEGTEPFELGGSKDDVIRILRALHVKVPEVNLYEPRIRTLAKALGPVIIRYSGGWANRTYYDFDGHTGGVAPDGFEYVLTRDQWQGALDFAKEVGGQILISVANSYGVHENGTGKWLPDQAKLLFDYTAAQGMKIDYAEFMNEPNLLVGMQLPEGYSPADYARDHDLFAQWLAENHPETELVGPCGADSPRSAVIGGNMIQMASCDTLMEGWTIMPKIFSYHSYNGNSERGQFFGGYHGFDKALTEEYLAMTMDDQKFYGTVRDKYMPGADLWVTESADAACGGTTWAPTFTEVIRFVDELCRFNLEDRGILFHNTLCSSAYGLLEAETHNPRPQYWGGLLFNKLAGNMVFDTAEPIREGVHLYAFDRKDGKEGICYVYINNSKTESVELNVPACTLYTLHADKLRSREIKLNGRVLTMPDANTMPDLSGDTLEAGTITLAPCTVSFIVV